jgi:hypothetical protein
VCVCVSEREREIHRAKVEQAEIEDMNIEKEGERS